MDVELARTKMLSQQVRPAEVFDPRVLEVLGAVPRERFVPERFRNLAFAEVQIPIGHGETMMEPRTEGRMLQALAVRATDRVLEVGTGSGFITACLARLGASVASYDVRPEFTERARARLELQGIRNATLATEDLCRLPAGLGRFEAIAVTGALPAPEPSFQQHLSVGGRLFVVVGAPPAMEALLITRVGEDAFTRQSLFETDLAWLRNAKAPSRFQL
jgi:protein-L-isoaspartate(D-aspartate) O-methyltransferase